MIQREFRDDAAPADRRFGFAVELHGDTGQLHGVEVVERDGSVGRERAAVDGEVRFGNRRPAEGPGQALLVPGDDRVFGPQVGIVTAQWNRNLRGTAENNAFPGKFGRTLALVVVDDQRRFHVRGESRRFVLDAWELGKSNTADRTPQPHRQCLPATDQVGYLAVGKAPDRVTPFGRVIQTSILVGRMSQN